MTISVGEFTVYALASSIQYEDVSLNLLSLLYTFWPLNLHNLPFDVWYVDDLYAFRSVAPTSEILFFPLSEHASHALFPKC